MPTEDENKIRRFGTLTPTKADRAMWRIKKKKYWGTMSEKTCAKPGCENLTKLSWDLLPIKYCCGSCKHRANNANEKSKQTKLKKYGDENYYNHEKSKQTKLERYGDPFYNNLEKNRATCLEKYGTEYFFQTKEYLQKAQRTYQEKYGVNWFMQTNEFKHKSKNTLKQKYGIENIKQKHLTKQQLHDMKDLDLLLELNKTLNYHEIADKIGCSLHPIWVTLKAAGHKPKVFYRSTFEKEVCLFLEENGIEYEENARGIIKSRELDIFIPSLNLAIECNGIYWHSELAGRDRNYHLNKTNLCADKGIDLIHIFDRQWEDKNDIVKHRLLSKLGQGERVFARKTTVRTVCHSDGKQFCEKYHLQGHANSSIRYGLYDKDELVALMTFCKSRYSKNHEYELLRYVSSKNVVGGAAKLFKHFTKTDNPLSVVSYCDRSWNTGGVYTKIGMTLSHESKPNCYYFHNSNAGVIYSRLLFQKHKLKDVLNDFKPELSAWENMINNNYNRYWDCGNFVFEWNRV